MDSSHIAIKAKMTTTWWHILLILIQTPIISLKSKSRDKELMKEKQKADKTLVNFNFKVNESFQKIFNIILSEYLTRND